MGPRMSTTLIPADLADVSLIDAKACAAASGCSVSKWHQDVASGSAPQPVIRKPRCTRWRMADVRAHLIEIAAQGADTEQARSMIAKAAKASTAARAKRQALQAVA